MVSSVWGGPLGGVEERGRSRFADVGEDLCDGLGVRKERDKGERGLTGGTDQRKHSATNASRRCPRARRAAHLEGREGAVSGVRVSPPSGWGAGAAGGIGRGRGRPGTSAVRAFSSRACSVTRGLRGALGAKTPWYRWRWMRGGGRMVARRSRNSRAERRRAVRPAGSGLGRM